MVPEQAERRLAAIMFTDIAGYRALMAESEEKGLRARERHRALVRVPYSELKPHLGIHPGDLVVQGFPES